MRDDHAIIRSYLERYKTAKAANSKEIRLTIHEAEQLTSALSLMLSRESELSAKIIDLQGQIMAAEVQQDGGKF